METDCDCDWHLIFRTVPSLLSPVDRDICEGRRILRREHDGACSVSPQIYVRTASSAEIYVVDVEHLAGTRLDASDQDSNKIDLH